MALRLPLAYSRLPASALRAHVARPRPAAQPTALPSSLLPPGPATTPESKSAPAAGTKQVVALLLRTITHVRDATVLILGGVLLHLTSLVAYQGDDASGLADCYFLTPGFAVVLAVLWLATATLAVARFFEMLNSLGLNTALDVCLIVLGSTLQLLTRPTTDTRAHWCPVDGDYGAVALVGFLLGDGLSFLSAARTIADWGLRPPGGRNGLCYAVVFTLIGIVSFPLNDTVLAPLVQDGINRAYD